MEAVLFASDALPWPINLGRALADNVLRVTRNETENRENDSHMYFRDHYIYIKWRGVFQRMCLLEKTVTSIGSIDHICNTYVIFCNLAHARVSLVRRCLGVCNGPLTFPFFYKQTGGATLDYGLYKSWKPFVSADMVFGKTSINFFLVKNRSCS